jgi:hypothetical protein
MIAPGNFGWLVACELNERRLIAYVNAPQSPSAAMLGLPATLHRIEGDQMSRCGCAAFDLVEVHDLQAGCLHAGRRSGRSMAPKAARSASRPTAAHAIDSNFHGGDPYDSTIVELWGGMMSVL